MIPANVNFIFSSPVMLKQKVKQLGKFKLESREEEESTPYELLDCFDQSIRQSGQVLTRSNKALQLRQQDGSTLVQRCSKPVGFVIDLADGPVKEALSFVSPLRRLLVVGKGRISYSNIIAVDDDCKTQARAYFQTYLADGIGKPIICATVQALRGYEKAFGLLVKMVGQFKGREQLNIDSLYVRLVPNYHPYQAKPDIKIVRDEVAFQAANDIVATYIEVARRNELGIIADYDSEFLHDYRVSLRKIRSVISLFKGIYSDKQTQYFKQAFSAQMEPTGRLRDLDVYLLEREHYFELLPSSLHKGLTIMYDLFEKERHEQHKVFKKRLMSRGYDLSINAVAALFASPEQLAKGRNATHSAYSYACELIWKRYVKVCNIARKIDNKTADEQVHELRIDCKKLRYLMEFFAPLFPVDVIKKVIKSLKRLQDNLGLFNDYSVQQESLQLFLDTHTSKNPKKDLMVAKSVGALMMVLHQRQLQERAKVVNNFNVFDHENTQKQFQTLFQHERE